MGLPAVIAYVRDQLNGLALPVPSAQLAAYITPPDPNVETFSYPTLYVLTADGPEKRLTMPRNTGPGTSAGDKAIDHDLKLHVIWMIAGTAEDPDLMFAGVIEGIMAQLRTTTAPYLLTDPWTGQQTMLVDTGEKMTYHYLPRHSVKNQRVLRHDALIDLPVQELIQA